MFTKEEVDSWNELFPNCKIRENDLSHPTEGFLIKTLVAHLRIFGYKVEPPFVVQAEDAPQTREKRIFLIKLTRQIDKILKMTDKSYTFTYYDLIRPTPKKTSHMLGILLNYLYYHNMYKTNVFKVANERIIAWQELQQRICRTQEENEQRKSDAAKVKAAIAYFSVELPAAQAQLEKLSARKEAEKEEIQKLQELIKDLNIKTEELKAQKRNLKMEIVPNEEARELKAQFTKLQEEIIERQAVEIVTETSLKERRQNIESLNKLLNNIEKIREMVPIKLLEDFQNTNKKLKETKDHYNTLVNKKQQLLNLIEKQGNELKLFEEKLKLKQQKFEQEKNKKLELTASQEEQCNTNAVLLLQLKHQDHLQECALQEQRDIRDFIQEHMAELMSAYV